MPATPDAPNDPTLGCGRPLAVGVEAVGQGRRLRLLGRLPGSACLAVCCDCVCPVALALLLAVFALCACIAARCFCVTAGQGATSNAIALEVALRRRLCLAFPHPAAHGLLSLISLLRAFLTKRNQA